MQGRENRVIIRIALNWIYFYFFFSRKLSQTFGTYVLVGVMLILPVEQLGVCFPDRSQDNQLALAFSELLQLKEKERKRLPGQRGNEGQGEACCSPFPHPICSTLLASSANGVKDGVRKWNSPKPSWWTELEKKALPPPQPPLPPQPRHPTPETTEKLGSTETSVTSGVPTAPGTIPEAEVEALLPTETCM